MLKPLTNPIKLPAKEFEAKFGTSAQTEKRDSIWKEMAKDPIKTLLVSPAVRTAQAGVAAFGGEKGRRFAEKDIKVKIPVLGEYNIPAQKTGAAGLKQIGGEALKTASYLFTPPGAKAGVSAGLSDGRGVLGKILSAVAKGGVAGGVGGGMYGAGQAMVGGGGVKDVAVGAGQGAVGGFAFGGALGAAPLAAYGAVKVLKPVGRALKRIGEAAYGLTVTPPVPKTQALLRYQASKPSLWGRVKDMLVGPEKGRPIMPEQTAARHGLMGTEWEIGVQSRRAMGKIWDDKIGPRLKADKDPVYLSSFFDDVAKEISKIKGATRRRVLSEALEKIREDYKYISRVSLERLQNLKSEWRKVIPQFYWKGKEISGGLNSVQAIMADVARSKIIKRLGKDVELPYFDYGNLEGIVESAVSSKGDPAKRSFGRNAWEFLMDKAVTPVVTVSGRMLYRTGEGSEFIGQKGAKTLRDIFYGKTLPPRNEPKL